MKRKSSCNTPEAQFPGFLMASLSIESTVLLHKVFPSIDETDHSC
jgi:hypothetical protein